MAHRNSQDTWTYYFLKKFKEYLTSPEDWIGLTLYAIVIIWEKQFIMRSRRLWLWHSELSLNLWTICPLLNATMIPTRREATQDCSSKAILATAAMMPIATNAADDARRVAKKYRPKVNQHAFFKIFNKWKSLQNKYISVEMPLYIWKMLNLNGSSMWLVRMTLKSYHV